MNFTSKTFKSFCSLMSIQKSITSTYNYQSNGQVEACIKVAKMHSQKCLDTAQCVSLTLLQIGSSAIGMGLPNLVILLFNRSIKGLLSQMLREPIYINNNDPQY